MSSKVLVTGGTGLIGTALIPKLTRSGYDVRLLSRKEDLDAPTPRYSWDLSQGSVDPAALEDLDYIIHLAGASVGEGRWTPTRKKEILESRILSTKLLLGQIKALGINLRAFVSSSAVGYYGANTGDNWMDESKPKGDGFLADVTHQWENEALKFKDFGIRTVCIRTGVVLAPKGGALQKMALPVKLGAGAALGSGKQYISWIHLNDLCEVYLMALAKDTWSGVYNATAPGPVTNSEFTRTLGKTLKKPIWLPNVPSFSLKLMLGEMASIVLGGNRVSSQRIVDEGMIFKYPNLALALEDLLA